MGGAVDPWRFALPPGSLAAGEQALVKAQGLLDALVPVCPGVPARELRVLVRDGQGLKLPGKLAIAREQGVVRATVEAQAGEQAAADAPGCRGPWGFSNTQPASSRSVANARCRHRPRFADRDP